VRLLLIRHGQSKGNAAGYIQGRGEYPLSDLGREQAHRMAQRLSEEYDGIAAVYTSPQSRAVETAEILAEAVGVPLTFDDRLQEYDIGALTGLTMEEVREQFPRLYDVWMQDPDEWLPFPHAETHESFRRRVREVFAEIATCLDGTEFVAVVSHGGTLGAYLADVVGLPIGRRHPFYFANASLTVVDLSRRRPRVAQLNDTCHLADIGGGQ